MSVCSVSPQAVGLCSGGPSKLTQPSSHGRHVYPSESSWNSIPGFLRQNESFIWNILVPLLISIYHPHLPSISHIHFCPMQKLCVLTYSSFAFHTGPSKRSVNVCRVKSELGLNSSTPQGRPPSSSPTDQVHWQPRCYHKLARRRTGSWPGLKHGLYSDGPRDRGWELKFLSMRLTAS